MLRSEVLPAPFGPIIEAISPRRTLIDTSSTARTPPNRFDTPVTARCTSSVRVADVAATAMPRLPPNKRDGRMRPGYGRHDVDAIAIMQPSASVKTSAQGADLGACRRPLRVERSPAA